MQAELFKGWTDCERWEGKNVETATGTVTTLKVKSAGNKMFQGRNQPGKHVGERDSRRYRWKREEMEKIERMKDDERHVKAKYRQRDVSLMLE